MLQINSQRAILGIETNNAKIEYTNPKGSWDMRTVKAQMEVSPGWAQVRIDQTIPFAEAGRKTLSMLVADYADLGKQAIYEGTARRAQEGDLMARPPYGDAIKRIAISNLPTRADFNIKFIPQSRPEIDFVNLEKEISWQIGGSERTFHKGKGDFNYQAGGVNVYMEQYNSIDIQFIDTKV